VVAPDQAATPADPMAVPLVAAVEVLLVPLAVPLVPSLLRPFVAGLASQQTTRL